jgi:hypothetical protein
MFGFVRGKLNSIQFLDTEINYCLQTHHKVPNTVTPNENRPQDGLKLSLSKLAEQNCAQQNMVIELQLSYHIH